MAIPNKAVPLPVEEAERVADSGFFGFPKWFVACAVGSVVVGLAAYYVLTAPDEETLKKTSGTPNNNKKKTERASSSPKPKAKNKKPVEVLDLPEDEEELPSDPLARAIISKNKGNKYFRGGRYELAIKCYSDAIDSCPATKESDLSTFYQNRAAAHEQLEQHENALSDCNDAIRLNNRYVKALERRARVQRKIASINTTPTLFSKDVVDRLRVSLEDMTAVCLLEGFQKQEHLLLVDTILKELSRSEARIVFSERKPVLNSKHFIQQYFLSFLEDPIMKGIKSLDNSSVNGDSHLSSYDRILIALKNEKFDEVVDACNDAIEELASAESEDSKDKLARARLVRATFYLLSMQHKLAMDEMNLIIENETADPKLRANALIKRASLYIQRCQDPQEDSTLSFKDFERAAKLDPDNADVYHHRGQVNLLTENTGKAIDDFEKAVSLNPVSPIAQVQKLFTEYRMAMEKSDHVGIKNVMNSFEDAISTFPDCVETYALFAQILCDQQEYERADKYYTRAMGVDPTNANLWVHRGLVALQVKGDVQRARELIKKGLAIDDKCGFAYETLGTVEVQSGNLKSAVELFEKAIPLANTELEMRHILALKSAAVAQSTISARLGIQLPSMMMD